MKNSKEWVVIWWLFHFVYNFWEPWLYIKTSSLKILRTIKEVSVYLDW
jgi:hypothetical protein